MDRRTFEHNGSTFGFDVVVNVYERTAEWHANIFRDGVGVGQRHGSIRREVIVPSRWNKDQLTEVAQEDVMERIRNEPSAAWD